MNQKLKISIKFTDNVTCKYANTKIYIEGNMKEKTLQWKR